jgi:Spy/CpxP family protein refolding chaperone
MVWQRLAMMALTSLALASADRLLADKEQKQPDKNGDRLDAVASKLDLTDKQKQQVKQAYADFDKKAEPLMRQLCTQQREAWQTIRKMLTEEQRAKVNDICKAQGDKELQAIVQKLNLTEEQKKQIVKIREQFWKKFLTLGTQKDENLCREYREMYMDAMAAARTVLTPEQRTKLPAIQKQDFHEWHDYTLRPDHMKAMSEQLGLSAEQRKQLQEISDSAEKKMEEPRAQLKKLCKEQCTALEKVLNAEQRAKLHEAFPFNFLDAEHPEKK